MLKTNKTAHSVFICVCMQIYFSLPLVKTGKIVWKPPYCQPHGHCWEPGRAPPLKASWLADTGQQGIRRARGLSLYNGAERKGKQQLLVKRFLSLNCTFRIGSAFSKIKAFFILATSGCSKLRWFSLGLCSAVGAGCHRVGSKYLQTGARAW